MWGTKTLDMSLLTGHDDYWLHPFSAEQNFKPSPWTGNFSDLTPEQIQAITNNFAKDWVYLGRYSVERLDLKGESGENILAQGLAGHQFEISVDWEPVRYIRFFPLATLGGSPPPWNYWHIGELSFFGDNTVPQE
jgi:hypothetical protein